MYGWMDGCMCVCVSLYIYIACSSSFKLCYHESMITCAVDAQRHCASSSVFLFHKKTLFFSTLNREIQTMYYRKLLSYNGFLNFKMLFGGSFVLIQSGGQLLEQREWKAFVITWADIVSLWN
jgi:hypothetical protein